VQRDIYPQVNVHRASFLQHRSDSADSFKSVETSLSHGNRGLVSRAPSDATYDRTHHALFHNDHPLRRALGVRVVVTAYGPVERRRVRSDVLHCVCHLRRKFNVIRDKPPRRAPWPPPRGLHEHRSVPVKEHAIAFALVNVQARLTETTRNIKRFVHELFWGVQRHVRHRAQVFLHKPHNSQTLVPSTRTQAKPLLDSRE
jgi:hypothetical protein